MRLMSVDTQNQKSMNMNMNLNKMSRSQNTPKTFNKSKQEKDVTHEGMHASPWSRHPGTLPFRDQECLVEIHWQSAVSDFLWAGLTAPRFCGSMQLQVHNGMYNVSMNMCYLHWTCMNVNDFTSSMMNIVQYLRLMLRSLRWMNSPRNEHTSRFSPPLVALQHYVIAFVCAERVCVCMVRVWCVCGVCVVCVCVGKHFTSIRPTFTSPPSHTRTHPHTHHAHTHTHTQTHSPMNTTQTSTCNSLTKDKDVESALQWGRRVLR